MEKKTANPAVQTAKYAKCAKPKDVSLPGYGEKYCDDCLKGL